MSVSWQCKFKYNIGLSLNNIINVGGSCVSLNFYVPVARSRAPSFLAPMFVFVVLRGICDMYKFL